MSTPTVVITGASTGIGLAFAQRALAKGWNVVATARNPAKIDLPDSPRVRKIALDVTSDASVEAFAREIANEPTEGPLFLLNNAGLAVGGPIEAVPISEWERQLQTNVIGVVRVTKALLPKLRAHRGRIVNIGSVSGRLASPFMGPYSASKFALRALNDSLRREMKPLGVHVTLIEPGPVRTPIWDKSKSDGAALRASLTPELLKVYGAALDPFLESVEGAVENAVPVDAVSDVIEKAFTDPSPRQYDAPSFSHAVQSALGTLVPGPLLDRLIGAAFRFGKKN